MGCFCFFKQKTAYEMRISDWSADVCSSDLAGERVLVTAGAGHQGKLLIPKLAQAGFRVRAVRRSEGKGDELKALGAHEVFIGDLGDEETYFEALKDVDAVYHIGPGGAGNEEIGRAHV